jgi:hypothetical protein
LSGKDWLNMQEPRSMAESDRDLVRRAATMGAFYRPGDQPDAVELFDAFVERLLELEKLGYLTVSTESEFILTTGRFRGVRTQLTPRGRAFANRRTGAEEPIYH